MNCFNTLTCNWSFGMIGEQAKEAIELAKLTKRTIEFTFNECQIIVTESDTLATIGEQYHNKLRTNRDAN